MSRDALVVGINTYQYLPSLKAPARDAEAISQQLHTYGEFRIHRLPEVIQDGKPLIGQKTQVTLRELETALINLFKPKGSSIPQTATFYFSGHGIQRDAGIREGYLALSDSNPDKGFYGLSLFWLRRLLQESPVRQRIIWLDCCHSGELLNFLEADPGAHPGTDRLFMAASREYETAYESLDSQYSVFTDALLTGLDPNRIGSGVITNHSLTDWVNHTLKGEIQQPLFESSGSEIILTRRSGKQASSSSSTLSSIRSKDICPYRGLEFFDESHAEYFFGREDLTAQLIKKLTENHFVTVAGASGSGKSSLVRAGLISQLRQGKKVPGSDRWKIRLITPTEHPLKSLAAAFIDLELGDLERAEQLRRAETFLQDGGTGLAQLVRASLSTGSTSLSLEQRPQFLLVIDQFEEVFTLSQGSHAEKERQEFFDCLIGALAIVKDLLSIVIVLRADFLSRCSLYEGLAQQITQHQVMVLPLKYEQIKATIVRPAQKVGLICEPNLVYAMLLDVIGAPGELPLLQYTLSELWRERRVDAEGGVARLTLDAYQDLGGVRGTLQKRATEVFDSLTEEEQGVARRIFLALTQLGEGTEDTRRRVVKSELVSSAFPMVLVEQVLEKLVAAKLVIISQESPNAKDQQVKKTHQDVSHSRVQATVTKELSQEIVDVTHEALIRNWSVLRSWLEESREMLRRERRIEQAAQEWQRAGQPSAGEFLLHGLRLRDAEDFLRVYPQELSTIAQQYIDISYSECRRTRQESRQLQIAIPSILAATLAIVLIQYYSAVRAQTEKEDQLQQATSRERAAIAQAMLQDSNADPMTALLIGRLAAESKEASYEAQSSLRAALQNLRLQLELQGHEGSVQQLAYSPDHRYLGTAGLDGTIRLWAINSKTIYNASLNSEKVLAWSDVNQPAQSQTAVQAIAFSPTGKNIAGIGTNSSTVKVWSVESGTVIHELVSSAIVKQVSFSPTGEWIATLSQNRSISIWEAQTGVLKILIPQNSNINSIQFSPNGQFLLSAGEDGIAQLWQFTTDATRGLKLNLFKSLAHPEVVYQAVFSPSGRWVATLCKDGKVRLWDAQTGQLLHLLSKATTPVLEDSADHEQTSTAEQAILPPIQQLEFSPNEQTLATIDSNRDIWLWHTQSGKLYRKLNDNGLSLHAEQSGTDRLELMKFSPNGQMLVTTTSTMPAKDGYSAYLWNSQTGQQISKLSGHRQPITSVQFSPDGTYVVTASEDGTIRLWAAELGGELPSLQLAGNPVEWITFLPTSISKKQIANPKSTSLNVTRVGSEPFTSADETDGKKQLENFDQQNPSLVSSSKNQFTRWQPWRNWLNLKSPQPRQTRAVTADLSSSNKSVVEPKIGVIETASTNIATITADGKLQQWQILTNTSAGTVAAKDIALTSHYTAIEQSQLNTFHLRNKLTALASNYSPNPNKITIQPAISGIAQSVKALFLGNLFKLPTADNLVEKLGIPSTNGVRSGVAMSRDGHLLATADPRGWIVIYKVQFDQSLQVLHRIYNWHSTGSKTDLLSEVVASTAPKKTDQSQKGSGKPGIPAVIGYLTFSPDGQQLLGIADDLTMRSWNVRSGQQLAVFRGHEAAIRQARYSADGQWIISASWDQTARIWKAATGQVSKVLTHEDAVSSASFSPNGQQVATSTWKGTAQIWQISTGKSLFLLNKHQKSILDAQFSPDGTMLVTASTDGTARLWNTATGEEQALLQPTTDRDRPAAILQAFFSPDGNYVATLTNRGRVNLWAATQDMLLKIARERSLRQLTPEECSQYLRLSPDQCAQVSS